jgi:hypothetical protein
MRWSFKSTRKATRRRPPWCTVAVGCLTIAAVALVLGSADRADAARTATRCSNQRLVSSHCIGYLALGGATKRQVRARLGGPDRIWASSEEDSPPVLFTGELWGYSCTVPDGQVVADCRDLFGFKNGHLTAFSTRSRAWRSPGNLRVGASLAVVRAATGAHWTGWAVQCAGAVFGSLDGTMPGYVMQMDSRTRRVRSIYASVGGSRAAFSACGS